jgi:hypothetical protein
MQWLLAGPLPIDGVCDLVREYLGFQGVRVHTGRSWWINAVVHFYHKAESHAQEIGRSAFGMAANARPCSKATRIWCYVCRFALQAVHSLHPVRAILQ